MPNTVDVPSKWTARMGAVVAKTAELFRLSGEAGDTLESQRRAYEFDRAFWNAGGPDMARTEDARVQTPHGEVAVRRYYPTVTTEWQPGIVFFHGGGFSVGSLDTHDRMVRSLAAHTGAPAVSVAYTLAPEAKHPQQVEECAAVVRHVIERGSEWGIDGTRLTLAGDSAGGFLALATYLYLREEMQLHSSVHALLLFYPWLGLWDSPSMRMFGGEWDGLARESMVAGIESLLPDRSAMTAPYFDLFSHDLTREMPAVYLAAAELDPVRDDARLLASILAEHGLPVAYDEFPGILHAFMQYGRMLEEAETAFANSAAFWRTHAAS